MGSLGGDISALYVNPAGLGFYRTNEFVISPQFSFNKNAATFINNPKDTGKNAFALGTIGVIFGEGSNKKGKKSSAFSIGITQTANFNNRVYYKGINDYSSFSETFAEEFAKSGISTDELLNTLSPLPYTAAPAYYTYLIDIDTSNGISQVRAAPEQLLDAGGSLQQSFLKETQGGLYELALGGAINTNDKWLFGGTLGIPIVDFTSTTTVTEKDASGNTKNGFQSFSYEDEYRTTGVGFNVKLGAIYRPAEYFRLGLALHTASFIFLKDERTANLNTILEDTAGNAENFSVSSLLFTNNEASKDVCEEAPVCEAPEEEVCEEAPVCEDTEEEVCEEAPEEEVCEEAPVCEAPEEEVCGEAPEEVEEVPVEECEEEVVDVPEDVCEEAPVCEDTEEVEEAPVCEVPEVEAPVCEDTEEVEEAPVCEETPVCEDTEEVEEAPVECK